MAIRFCIFLLIYFVALHCHAEKITVAAASNFSGAMNAIVNTFEKDSSHEVNIVFGSSGKLYAQIRNGAPFQLFFSADQEKPLALEKNGWVVPDSRFTYAVGTLALWSVNPATVDDQAGVLKQGDFNKLALANPKLAPYGIAAVEVLRNLEVEAVTSNKKVYGENISQAYQFVATGNADIGFVSLSQIIDFSSREGGIKEGSAWIVPSNLHEPIRQDAVLLQSGKDSDASEAFLTFVQGEKAAAIIKSYGYSSDNLD